MATPLTNETPSGHLPELTQSEYDSIRRFIHQHAGIELGPGKLTLVSSRLSRRLRHYGLNSYARYLKLALNPANGQELQILVDLLTTNETYFFREPSHFQFFTEHVAPQFNNNAHIPRIWSAAASTGEEAYTLAMIMSETRAHLGWEIIGTDINRSVLDHARAALYPIEAAERIEQKYLYKYCLKGVREQAGYFTIDSALKKNVKFQPLNLNGEWPSLGEFDVIFLRNVMIYFDKPSKKRLIERMIRHLRPGGYLFIGLSETLFGINSDLKTVKPAIYQKT